MKILQIRRYVSTILVLAIVFSSFVGTRSVSAAWPEPVRGRHAMVASQHELASKIGAEIMKKGGNAVDAAIAVGLALAVVYPEAGNIGGGGFMLIRKADGTSYALDYREMAPAAANRDIFVDKDGKLINGEGSSTIGYRASGVPGTLAGFDMAFKKYGSGKIRWRDLVEPARALAQNGYVLSHRLAELLKAYKGNLSKYADSNRIFLRDGKYYGEGEVFRQPDLAATLSRVQTLGAREFYTGKTAQLIAADMKANNGLITLDDLKNYKAKERKPLTGTYRGYPIITMPPPSSGGVTMCEILHILEGYPLAEYGWSSAQAVHVTVEAMRHAYVDRNRFLGDPDFVDNPVARLLSDAHVAEIRARIDPEHAGKSSELAPELLQPKEGTHTTHYSIADRFGNAVSVTYTLNDWFGARVTAAGTGIVLNNEMDDFTSKPGTPNLYGLVQGAANAIAPGKRPLSSMTPSIVLRDGKPVAVLGTPGGSTIITAVLQTLLNLVDYGMDVQEAVDAPRFHHQWLPDEIQLEARTLSPDTRRLLEGRGHRFVAMPEPNHMAAILIGAPSLAQPAANGKRFYGANDPRRRTGLAAGY